MNDLIRGVTVQSVEMRDVIIPPALPDAMSREAQAAREKQARINPGQAEVEITHSFTTAAKSYHDNRTAPHLRAMNMLYEGLKEKGALMLVALPESLAAAIQIFSASSAYLVCSALNHLHRWLTQRAKRYAECAKNSCQTEKRGYRLLGQS